MFRKLIGISGALAGLAAAPCGAQTIGVYFDQAATDCDGVIPQFTLTRLYVCAVLGGEAAGGITGAEFRIDGFPPAGQWFGNWIPPIQCDLGCLGQPHTGGTNVAWPSCQQGTNGVVLLGSLEVVAFVDPGPVHLVVREHSNPSNSNFACPLVTLCDNQFTRVCVTGGEAMVGGVLSCPTVGVAESAWSGIKALYRFD